jgi:hypothetical protein
VLLECRQSFRDARDPECSARPSAPSPTLRTSGHGDAAIGLVRDALRCTYLAGDVIGIAVGYHNLGNYLRVHAQSATSPGRTCPACSPPSTSTRPPSTKRTAQAQALAAAPETAPPA